MKQLGFWHNYIDSRNTKDSLIACFYMLRCWGMYELISKFLFGEVKKTLNQSDCRVLESTTSQVKIDESV